MTNQSLYETLGGKEGVSAVVHEFYDRMITDQTICHYFIDIDTDILREHQILYFISYVLGGPKKYKGNNLRTSHKGLNITDDAYETAIRHMNGALRKYSVPPEICAVIEAFLRSVKPHIIEK